MISVWSRSFARLGFSLGLLLLSAAPLPAVAQTAPLDLASLKGRVVYLDFWASWCGPCKESFPYMKALSQKYAGRGLAVVTVNLDRSRPQADAFLKKIGVALPVTYDGTGALAKQFKVSDMPTSVLIDRTGRVRFTHKGFHPNQQAQYQAHIDQLINER